MKAILFDLDGTLLDVNFDELLKEYFSRIGGFFGDYLAPEQFIKHLMKATHQMIASQDPSKINLDVFAQVFFGSTGLDPKMMDEEFPRFYAEEFPKLRHLAKPQPLAREVVELAFQQGYKVVIATNPVFPAEAIRQRIEWAAVDDFDYDLVTTGENMHFCKPNPQYYLEIAEKLGESPTDCLMIGDDPENDGPASQVGMDTLLLTNGNTLEDVSKLLAAQRRA